MMETRLEVLRLGADDYIMKPFTKANLFETIWGETYYPEDNTLNVYMSNLRNKLKKVGNVEYIEKAMDWDSI